MKKEMFAVSIITKFGTQAYELANFGEMASDTARRIFYEQFKKEARSVVALQEIGRVSVEEIPEKIRLSWPKGAKTIPLYYFRVD